MTYVSKGSTSVLAGLRKSGFYFTRQDVNKNLTFLKTTSVIICLSNCFHNDISTLQAEIYNLIVDGLVLIMFTFIISSILNFTQKFQLH